MRYYYDKNGRVSGPFDVERLRGCLSRGSVDADTPIAPVSGPGSYPTNPIWRPLREVLPQLVAGSARGNTSASAGSAFGTSHRPAGLEASSASKPVLICAVGLFVGFFLPWAQVFGFALSGYSLGKLGSYGNYAWIIPILAGITILVSYSGGDNRLIGAISGIVPLGAILYGLYHVLGQADSRDRTEFFKMASQVLALGAWLTIGSGIGIIVAALSPPSTSSVSRMPSHGESRPRAGTLSGIPSASQPRPQGISDELGRLADLHRNGVLSADEFTAAKAKLLG